MAYFRKYSVGGKAATTVKAGTPDTDNKSGAPSVWRTPRILDP